MGARFFIVSNNGFILPVEYKNYESACANCESNEMIYMADSMELLEQCLQPPEDSAEQSF
ncbi:hypothetical protein [Syntrophomonas palmitatica]|uniref:hypothetical protein n=1 Tax=Syntrophomonas palmitatica TaxID=402877 RepID=UPI0006CF6923|nr:hypothetical protein [Syntrophomonas palmitatica]